MLPLIEYCSPVWSPHHLSDIVRIESVQRVFTKKLKDYHGLTCAQRLEKASLCTLELRRLRADLILCYKILNGLVAISHYQPFFELDNSSITRGNTFKIRLKNARLETRLYFYSSRTSTVWNSLTSKTVCSETASSFKANLVRENLSRLKKN